MRVIARVKAGGDLIALADDLAELVAQPWAAAADLLTLGCTELPLVGGALGSGVPILDVTDAFARATIVEATRSTRAVA